MAEEEQPRIVNGPDGHPYEVPPEATPAQISAYLKAIPAANAKFAPKARTWTDTAVDALPVVGGIAGGILGSAGGPAGAAAGAGLLGAAGQGLKIGVNRIREAIDTGDTTTPIDTTEAAKEMATSGLLQGATAGALGVAGKAASAVGKISPELLKTGALALFSPRLAAKRAIMSVIDDVAKDIAATAAPAEKLAISGRDYLNIRKLKDAGVSEGDAVRAIMNMKTKALSSFRAIK